jgi:hypothetical protein
MSRFSCLSSLLWARTEEDDVPPCRDGIPNPLQPLVYVSSHVDVVFEHDRGVVFWGVGDQVDDAQVGMPAREFGRGEDVVAGRTWRVKGYRGSLRRRAVHDEALGRIVSRCRR